MFRTGAYVQTWFDTGGGRTNGPRIIYGQIIAHGPKCATVLWESGLRNRIRHDDPRGVQLVHTARQHNAAGAMTNVTGG